MISSAQAALVKDSFDALWPHRQRFAALFYGRFFELAPDARALFPKDMERQLRAFIDMVAALVGSLDQRELFQSIIAQSAHRHADFGATPAQYAAFGDALIWSLERQFGAALSPEQREAWRALYAVLQQDMLQHAMR